jgi:hypothetical protein
VYRQHQHADKDEDKCPHEKIACLDGEVGSDVARCHDWFSSHFGDDRYAQTWASSRARARIWFLAACSWSAIDRLSGGPSVPTLTRPDISPRDEENVNVNDPRPSASKRIVSTLHTLLCAKKRTPANGIAAAFEVYNFSSLGCSFGLDQLLCTRPS